MSIFFFTDPHLGLSRMSHTTPASRARMQQRLYDQVQHVLHIAGDNPVICLGDLFDKSQNEEWVIKQGAEVARKCAVTLAGNHDLPNREGKLSSLQLLDAVGAGRIVVGGTDEPGFDVTEFTSQRIWLVPHMATQELFEQSLQEAVESCRVQYQDGNDPNYLVSVLCLHCNYDNGFAEGSDTSLNLTRDWARDLLEVFDFVLIGHEHVHRTDFNDRLVVLGNTLPLSFGEIDNRYCWELENGKLIPYELWDLDRSYSIPTDRIENFLMDELPEVDFINVVGEVDAAEMPAISRAIHKLWEVAPDALMIKNSVTIKEAVNVDESRELAKLADVPTRIAQDLAGTKLQETWNRYLERV